MRRDDVKTEPANKQEREWEQKTKKIISRSLSALFFSHVVLFSLCLIQVVNLFLYAVSFLNDYQEI